MIGKFYEFFDRILLTLFSQTLHQIFYSNSNIILTYKSNVRRFHWQFLLFSDLLPLWTDTTMKTIRSNFKELHQSLELLICCNDLSHKVDSGSLYCGKICTTFWPNSSGLKSSLDSFYLFHKEFGRYYALRMRHLNKEARLLLFSTFLHFPLQVHLSAKNFLFLWFKGCFCSIVNFFNKTLQCLFYSKSTSCKNLSQSYAYQSPFFWLEKLRGFSRNPEDWLSEDSSELDSPLS